MKIKAIHIKDYGPLSDFNLVTGNLELVYGLNEAGKTAVVEALSYVLFRKDLRNLRYGKPEVRVEIESAGKVYALTEKKPSPDLPANEVANLLYIEASKSAVYEEKGKARFWDSIKLMLSQAGQKISFSKIGEKILDSVGLTPQNKEWKKDKNKIIEAKKKRKEELQNYAREIGDIEKKRIDHARLSEERDRLRNDLEAIENFRKYSNYRNLDELHNKYIDKKNRLADYQRYEDGYYEEWQRLEAEKISRTELTNRRRGNEEAIKELTRKYDELKRTVQMVKAGGFGTYLSGFRRRLADLGVTGAGVSVLITIIAFFFSFIFKITLAVPLALAGISIVIIIIYLEKIVKLNKAKLVFPGISDLGSLQTKIDETTKALIELETRISEKTESIGQPTGGTGLEEVEKRISDLRNRTGIGELVQLKKKIDEKQTLIRESGGLAARLVSLLTEKDETKWRRLIDAQKVPPPRKTPDLSQENEIRLNYQKTKNLLDEHERAIRISEEMNQKRYNITGEADAFRELAQTTTELENHDLEKQAAIKAAEILHQMSGELDNFIEDIITGEESLERYFHFVTGRYKTIEIRDKNFLAVDDTGRKIAGDDLSSGTKDQLLLCFRMAVLKKIYPEGIFMILDDAFIFADWPRRKKLGELVKKFVDEGNQVIYLTSDDHTRDLFAELGARINTL